LKRLDVGHATPRSFHRVARVREYFNPRHFAVPVGQESLAQAETKKAEIAALTRLVQDCIHRAEVALQASGANIEANMRGGPNRAFMASLDPGAGVSAHDLAGVSGAFEGTVRRGLEFQRDINAFNEESAALWTRAEEKVTALREAFRKEWVGREVGEGGAKSAAFVAASEKLCTESRTIMEQALPAIAQRYSNLVVQISTRERVAINEELTYLPFIANGDLYRQEFYSRAIVYLQRVAVLAGVNPVHTYECGPVPGAEPVKPAEGELPTPDANCPINIKITLKDVGKLSADCKSIGIEVKAGLNISAKKNFQSGETTLKGGLGVDLDLDDVGKVEGSAGFVVVWDRGNSLSFIGVESSASASLSGIPALSESLDTSDNTTTEASIPATGTPDIVNVSSETRLGVTLGPRGVEPTLQGSAGAEVLGRDLVKASL
jgi:hypothetical protein